MGTEPSGGHGGVSEQSGGSEHGPPHQPASFHEATSSVNCGNQIPQDTKASPVFVEVTEVENRISQVPLFMDCQGVSSPGGIADPAKDMKVSLKVGPTLTVNLPSTAPRKLTQKNWEYVGDALERVTQRGSCDVEVPSQNTLDPLLSKDLGLGSVGPDGPILASTNFGKKTTWKKRARFNYIISGEGSRSKPFVEPTLTPGKQALQVEAEYILHDQDKPCLKKTRTDGGVESHESESVKAVE